MAHRQQPVANKLCAATWVARDVSRHRERLGLRPVRVPGGHGEDPISSVVDARPPRTLSLRVDRTAKRMQMADEAGAEIDRQNALLLAKMSRIVQHGQGAAHARAMGLDAATSPRRGPKSLNAGARERELARIGTANAAILRRLSERKPVYRRDEFRQHEQRHAAYLANMRERPLPPDAASPAARTLIPLPRFLREAMESGAATERRPPHAYMNGSYSSTFTHTGSSTGRYQTPQQQRQAAAELAASGSYARGSQSARGAASNYVLYAPTPNRTGVSKQSTHVHTLEPIAHRQFDAFPPAPQQHQQQEQQQQQHSRPPTLLLQSERSFPSQPEPSVVVSVLEMHGAGSRSRASSRPVSASVATAAGSPQALLSAPVQEGLHSMLFRLPAAASDPSGEARTVQVPWRVLCALPEVAAAASSGALDPSRRAALALVLLQRLQLGDPALGSKLSFSVALLEPEQEQNAVEQLVYGAHAHGRSDDTAAAAVAAAEAAAPMAATGRQSGSSAASYTDASGAEFYFDETTQQYLPMPAAAAYGP